MVSIMSKEYRRRITEGGELGEQFWNDLDAAFDKGEDLTECLSARGLSDTVIESIKAVYPNTPKRD